MNKKTGNISLFAIINILTVLFILPGEAVGQTPPLFASSYTSVFCSPTTYTSFTWDSAFEHTYSPYEHTDSYSDGQGCTLSITGFAGFPDTGIAYIGNSNTSEYFSGFVYQGNLVMNQAESWGPSLSDHGAFGMMIPHSGTTFSRTYTNGGANYTDVYTHSYVGTNTQATIVITSDPVASTYSSAYSAYASFVDPYASVPLFGETLYEDEVICSEESYEDQATALTSSSSEVRIYRSGDLGVNRTLLTVDGVPEYTMTCYLPYAGQFSASDSYGWPTAFTRESPSFNGATTLWVDGIPFTHTGGSVDPDYYTVTDTYSDGTNEMTIVATSGWSGSEINISVHIGYAGYGGTVTGLPDEAEFDVSGIDIQITDPNL